MSAPFDLKRHLPSTAFVSIVLLVIAGFAGAFIYTGIYNIGADDPHSKVVYSTLRELRENAIAHHSRNILVPKDLGTPQRIEVGAGLYGEMCTGCHLGPGVEASELSQGLYPPAPELAKRDGRSPAEQFWIIKHGVKLSAMPAWGKTHEDQLIWDMVAFIRQLPKMSPAQYQAALANAPASHDEMMAGMHDHGSVAEGAQQHGAGEEPHKHPATHSHSGHSD